MKQGFIIGGHWRFIEQSLAPLFAEYGISLDPQHHHAIDRRFDGPIPGDADVVVIIPEMIAASGISTDTAKTLCRRDRVPCIIGTRHKSTLRPLIEQQGFKRKISPGDAIAIVAQEREVSGPINKNAPIDFGAMSFEQIVSNLGGLVKAARDRHGVSEIMWSTTTSLEIKRTEIRNIQLEA